MMKRTLSSILVFSMLLSASPSFASAQFEPTKVSVVSNQKSKTIKANIYNLSDQQIKNAIALGQKDFDTIWDFEKSQRLKVVQSTIKVNQPTNVLLTTPYLSIARQSYIRYDNYEELSLAEAKKIALLFQKSGKISFEIEALGDSIDFAKRINVVLKQDGKIYQPIQILKDKFADESENWPDSPAYKNNLLIDFDINKIDFSKNAELIYLYAGRDLSVTYKVDFSKIK